MSDSRAESQFQMGERIGEHIADLIVALAEESERVAVIMGVAQIDLALERALKCLLHPNPGGQDSLFDPDRPLSTLSAKISLAYRMGLIDSEIEHCLQMLRRIRNDFAHSPNTERLSQSKHKNRLGEITRMLGPLGQVKELEANIKRSVQAAELADFCLTAAMVLGILEAAVHLNGKVAPNFTATFSPSSSGSVDQLGA